MCRAICADRRREFPRKLSWARIKARPAERSLATIWPVRFEPAPLPVEPAAVPPALKQELWTREWTARRAREPARSPPTASGSCNREVSLQMRQQGQTSDGRKTSGSSNPPSKYHYNPAMLAHGIVTRNERNYSATFEWLRRDCIEKLLLEELGRAAEADGWPRTAGRG